MGQNLSSQEAKKSKRGAGGSRAGGGSKTGGSGGGGGDDVKRQVDSDQGNSRPIYQLVDVKSGGGKLVELVKLSARRQSSSMSSTSLSFSSANKLGQAQDRQLDEHIRRLVEPLLYERGQGKRVPVRQLWRLRFNLLDGQPEGREGDGERAEEEETKLVCWRLDERGFVGETALHICFLLATPTHMILAQKLLELFPRLINDVYTCDEYFGESCLHMAIVNENIRWLKWLLERGAEVHQRCLGSFFLPADQRAKGSQTNERIRRLLASKQAQVASGRRPARPARPAEAEAEDWRLDHARWRANEFNQRQVSNFDGHCYWGEYPLSFAASLGLADCYRLLLASGADPNRQDSNGNSTLHMCVIANRLDMFDLCYSNGANLDLVNGQQLGPLALAAKLERVQMFFHILALRRQVTWTLCQVCFQRIPLAGLDSIDASDGSFNEQSLLAIVVSGVSEHAKRRQFE